MEKKEPKLDITPEQRQTFIDSIGSGVPITTALKQIGLYKDKFYFWKRLAEDIITIRETHDLNDTQEYEETETIDINDTLEQRLIKKHTYAKDIVDFIQEFEKAQANFISLTMTNLCMANGGDWTKFAWLLERRAPLDFGKKDNALQENEKKVKKIKVQYVDSKSDSKRLADMDKVVQEEVLGKKADE